MTRHSYYATPENRWAELIQPLIPGWLAPPQAEVARYFYEGLPEGQSIPWGAWALPAAVWGSGMLAVYLLMVATMVILRRPWVEQERLVFPLTQLPLEMVRGNDEGIFPPLFSQPVVVGRFCGPLCDFVAARPCTTTFFSSRDSHLFEPLFLFRRSVRLLVFVNFAIIGLSYFLNLQVAFSVWFFHLACRIQTGLFNLVGYQIKGHNETLTGSSIALSHQGMGAMIALVAALLWTARGHLRRVWRTALGREADPGDEMLSYRGAVVLWVGCAFYVFLWQLAMGIPRWRRRFFCWAPLSSFWPSPGSLPRAASVLPLRRCCPNPLWSTPWGPRPSGWKGLAGISMSYAWAAEMRTTVMASMANGLKLAHSGRLSGRRLFIGVVLALVAGMVGAAWITLYLNYTYGGINLRQFGVPNIAYRFLEDKINNPIGWGHIQPRLLFTGVGPG